MSKFWKAFGIATALAALVPVSIKEDKETGKKTYQSLLMSLDIKTDTEKSEKQIGLNIGDGIVSRAIADVITAKREAELFADDEPEAAVPFPEEEAPTPTPAEWTEPAVEEAGEEDFEA